MTNLEKLVKACIGKYLRTTAMLLHEKTLQAILQIERRRDCSGEERGEAHKTHNDNELFFCAKVWPIAAYSRFLLEETRPARPVASHLPRRMW
jgi:hypothetical protein